MSKPALQPNGNILVSVQLLPATYAALTAAADRDGISYADVINIALISHNAISKAADEAGHNLGGRSQPDPEDPA